MAWSKPRDNAGTYKTWRLEDEKDNVYRLLPGHPKAPDGLWKVYLRQHWGYRRPQKKDPTKTYPALFLCPREKNKDKMITHDCAECRKIERIKAKVDSISSDMKSRGKSEAEIKALLATQIKWLKEHNCDGKWNFLAKNRQNEIGILQIPHKAFLALEILRKKMRERYKIEDITDIEKGIWVNFTRTGKGNEMTFGAEQVMEVTADGAERLLRAPLTEQELDVMEKVLPPLNTVGTKLSDDQIEALAGGTEDPEEVDRIFKLSQPAERSASPAKPAPAAKKPDPEPDPIPDIPEDDIMSGSSGAEFDSPAPAAKPAPAPVVEDEEEALLRKAAEIRARKEAAAKAAAAQSTVTPAKPEPKPEPAPAPAAKPAPAKASPSLADFENMDEDTFLNQFK